LQITPIIHAIRHSFRIPIAPGITFNRFVYSYVIYGDTIVLIDTGVAGSENQIFERYSIHRPKPLRDCPYNTDTFPPDHIGEARTIQQTTGCSIAAHPAERT